MEPRHTLSTRWILSTWILWLSVGTWFYAVVDELGWAKGFYMAVNVGYSIGWGYPVEKEVWMDWFSVLFLLCGASAVAVLLVSLAEDASRRKAQDWYLKVLNEEKWNIRREEERHFRYWIHENKQHLLALGYWVVWIAGMSIWSCLAVGWSPIEGVYFATSSCSTGGLKPIPTDSPDRDFVIAGLTSALGIPLMGNAMAHGAMLLQLMSTAPIDEEVAVSKALSPLELSTFMALTDGSTFHKQGGMTKAEYAVLCGLRLGLLSPALLEAVGKRFTELDVQAQGTIQYESLLPDAAGDVDELIAAASTAADSSTPIRNSLSLQQSYGTTTSSSSGKKSQQTSSSGAITPLRNLYLSLQKKGGGHGKGSPTPDGRPSNNNNSSATNTSSSFNAPPPGELIPLLDTATFDEPGQRAATADQQRREVQAQTNYFGTASNMNLNADIDSEL